MKKIINKTPIIALVIVIMIMINTIVTATSATSYTRTFDSKGRFIRTQDAYLPDRTISDLELNKPEDIFIDSNDNLYIADTENKRILKYDTNRDKVLMVITHDELVSPRGLFITEEKDIYVADNGARAIFRFSSKGDLIEKFTRPDSPSFNNDFNPLKVAVDKAGNMYVLAEGTYDGIIQLAHTGEFLGYFTSNKVALSWIQKLQYMFFTKEQKNNLLAKTPITFSNVYVDKKGIVYSATMGETIYPVKKHNTAGQNMLKGGTIATTRTTDLYTDANGIIYSASKDGYITVYTSEGEFIHYFGSNTDQDISGLFTSLSALAVDSQGKIWTVDSEKSLLQSFTPTEYSSMTYQALTLFNEGKYEESIKLWNEILNYNQMSVLAHSNIGKNYLFEEEYEKAMEHTKIAGNRFYYSQAFWEVRNIWLQKNLSYILGIILILYIISKITKWADKKWKILNKPRKIIKKIYSIKPIKDVLFIFKVFRHPIDSFYDIKVDKQGSYTGAIIIYLGVFITYVWYLVGKGFIYQLVAAEDIDLRSITLGYFAISLLFVLCNYLVSSINDGEGSFGQIFKMLSYALGPLLVSLIIMTIASHYLTFNEVFLLQIIRTIGILWTGINILLGIQEIHTYDTSDAIISIILTISFMIIIAIILVIVIIMSEQLYQFFEAIIKEVIRNVFS